MAAPSHTRILVHLKKQNKDQAPVLAKFTQSVLDYFQDEKSKPTKHEISVFADLKDNNLHVTDVSDINKKSIKLKRPPFCPIHNMTSDIRSKLPEDILNRGIDTGAAVILESSDNKVLLTRRSKSLRTFPGIWVPPGGHLEKDETLIEAGLRELKEETGLDIKPSECVGGDVQLLALWESSFPPKLTLGQPKRHHIVIYLYGKLKPSHTSDELMKQIRLQPEEAEACGWFDRKTVEAIVSRKEDAVSSADVTKSFPESFKGLIINEDKQQVESDIPFMPLFNVSDDLADGERVSTGTKFALEEWLQLTAGSL